MKTIADVLQARMDEPDTFTVSWTFHDGETTELALCRILSDGVLADPIRSRTKPMIYPFAGAAVIRILEEGE